MLRALAATLVALVCWLGFSLGGARLFSRRLTEVVDAPVTVGRLGVGTAPLALVLHEVAAGPVRARLVRIPLAAARALWARSPALHAATARGVRIAGPPSFRAAVVEVDTLALDAGGGARFAGRVRDRHGVLALHRRWRDRPVVRARLRSVDARTLAPLVSAVALRGGRVDGRVRIDDGIVRGDLRARHLAFRAGEVMVRAGRAAVDGLVADPDDGPAAARRATGAAVTVRRAGIAPLRGLAFVARDLDTRRGGAAVVVRATLAGGRLRARGTIDPPRRGLAAVVKVDRVGLRSLLDAPGAELRATGGRLSGGFRVAGPPWAAERITAAVDALRLVEAARPDAAPVLACERAVADAERLDAWPLRLRLRRAALDGLGVRLRREPEGLWPLTRLTALAATLPVQALLATPPEGSGPTQLSALDVAWADGRLVVEDRVLEPPAAVAVADVAGTLHQEAGGAVRRIAAAAGGTLAGAALRADVSAEGSRWRIAVGLRGLDAAVLDPWLRPTLGLTAAGTVSLHADVDLRGRDFDAQSRLVAEPLVVRDLGDGPRVLGLPVARALALARDAAGDLTLAVAASGATAAPGGAFVAAFADALGTAVVAPLAGGTVVVPFAAGSDALEEPAADAVDRVAALLHRRPALAVAVRGRAGADDAPADAESLAGARATRVRDRLCRERDVPEARVRTETAGAPGPPAALLDVAPLPSPPS